MSLMTTVYCYLNLLQILQFKRVINKRHILFNVNMLHKTAVSKAYSIFNLPDIPYIHKYFGEVFQQVWDNTPKLGHTLLATSLSLILELLH